MKTDVSYHTFSRAKSECKIAREQCNTYKADLVNTHKELEECKIQLRAADNGLLKASDPKSNWQGIQKECKLWQEKAESLEQELERCKKSLLCEEVEHNATMEELEALWGKVQRFESVINSLDGYCTCKELITKNWSRGRCINCGGLKPPDI